MPEQRQEIERVYADATKAFIEKDLEALDNLTALDFTADDGKAKKNRDEFMAGIRKQFESMDVISWDRNILSVKHQGDLVLVVTEGKFVAKQSDGSEVRLHLVNEDAWEKRNGRWIIRWARAIG